MHERLIELTEPEQFDKYVLFTFEYACQEARFLQLQEESGSYLEYISRFKQLCSFRRKVILDEIEEVLIEIANDYDDDTARRTRIPVLPYGIISYLIHKRYYPDSFE